MNTIGGIIPKVRVERITLDSGGRMIVEDNPHIVDESGAEAARYTELYEAAEADFFNPSSTNISVEEKRQYIRAAWDNIRSRNTAQFHNHPEYPRMIDEWRAIADLGENPEVELQGIIANLTLTYIANKVLRDFIAGYPTLRDNYDGVVRFEDVYYTGTNPRKYDLLRADAIVMDRFTGRAGAQGSASHWRQFTSAIIDSDSTTGVKLAIDQLNLFLESPNLDINYALSDEVTRLGGSAPEVYNLNLTTLGNFNIASLSVTVRDVLWRDFPGRQVMSLQTVVVPFIQKIVRAGYYRYRSDLRKRAAAATGALTAEGYTLDVGRVRTAQSNSEAPSDTTSVSLLLNVEATQSPDGLFSSWLNSQNLMQQLEFAVVAAFDPRAFTQIEGYLDNISTEITTIFRPHCSAERYFNEEYFARIYGSKAFKFNLASLMETNLSDLQSELQSEFKTDLDGNRVYKFNFEIQPIVRPDIANLRFYILPYINVKGFVEQLARSSGADDFDFLLEEEELQNYMHYFVGNPTIEMVVEDGSVVDRSSIFLVSETIGPYKEGEQWKGPAHYHPVGSPAGDGYTGWMGGEKHSQQSQQPRLRIHNVQNNKIQDNRALDRAQRFEYNLALMDIPEFLPATKTADHTGKNMYEALSPFTEIHTTRDVRGWNKLFFGIDLETIILQNSPIAALYRELPWEQRLEILSNTEINSIQIIRKQVKNFASMNSLGAPSSNYSNIAPRGYEVVEQVIVESNDAPAFFNRVERGVGYTTKNKILQQSKTSNNATIGKISEVTDILANKRVGNYTEASLRNNFSYHGKVRFFTAQDQSAAELNGGSYQYGVKVEIVDKTMDEFKSRKARLEQLLSELKQYYSLLMDNKNYNIALNKPYDFFVEAFDSGQALSSMPAQTNLVEDDPHIVETPDPVMGHAVPHVAGPTNFTRELLIPENMHSLPQRLSSQSGVLLKTLKLLSSAPSQFNYNKTSRILAGYLNVCTCSRGTVYRVIQMMQNTISRLEQIAGVSEVPRIASSPGETNHRSRGGLKRTNKNIKIEKMSSTIFSAETAHANGYYYLRPPSRPGENMWAHHENLFSCGVRELKKTYMPLLTRDEIRKSFYNSSPGGPGPRQEVPSFAEASRYSYLTPQYIVMSAEGSSLPQSNEARASYPRLLQNPDYFVFEHLYDTQLAAPAMKNTDAMYNLQVSRIRVLNEIKKADEVPVLAEDFFFRDNRNPALRAELAIDVRRDHTLKKAFSYKSCTTFDENNFNYLLNRLVRSTQNMQEEINQAADDPDAASLLGLDDTFTKYLEPSELTRLGSNVYFDTFNLSSAGGDASPIFDKILSKKKIYMTNNYINAVRNFPDADPDQVWGGNFRPGRAYEELPTSIKLLQTQADADAGRLSNISSPALTHPAASGLLDIHMNKIMEIQVLVRFDTVNNSDNMPIMLNSPIWRKATAGDFDYNVLCRLVPYENSSIKCGHPSYLDMEVFDNIFIVRGQKTEVEAENPYLLEEEQGAPPENTPCDPQYAVTLPPRGTY